jgi:hypothetical protein
LSPNILTNPTSQTVAVGLSATFTVVATGVPDPTYQWLLEGTNLDGATGASLTIPNAQAGNAGSYSVIVTTSSGSVTSAPAVLTVGTAPNTPPTFLAPASGANFTFNVGASIAISCTPSQTLTYSLLLAPTNVAINSFGTFMWRPTVAQGDSTNTITVVATDNGTPNLSATNTFTITVNPLTTPSVGSPSVTATPGQFTMSVSGQVGPDYTIQVSSNLLGVWTTLYTTNPTTMPFSFTDTNALSSEQYYRILVGP